MSTTSFIRLFFLLAIIIFCCAELTGQVKIIERVEIKPTAKIMADAGSSSSGLDTLFDYIYTSQGSPDVSVYLVRPSYVTISCNFTCDDTPAPVAVILGNEIIQNKTITREVICSFPLTIYNYSNSPMIIDGITTTTSSRIAHISYKGHVAYPSRNCNFNAEIELNAMPCAEPIVVDLFVQGTPTNMSADSMLDATGKKDPVSLVLYAATISNLGDVFSMCTRIPPHRIRIETPFEGVKIYSWWENTESNTFLDITGGPVELIWNGNRFPNGEDTMITVSASRFDLSDTCKIKLIKTLPDHFDIEPESNTVIATESVPIRAIAKTADDEEESFWGEKEVTLYAPWGGSFIVGADTLRDSAKVTYNVAHSGSVRYLDYYGIPWTGTEVWETPIEVWRTDHPDRRGQGIVDVMPLCLVVNTSAKEIGISDSVQINIMMKKPDTSKTFISFDANQLFSVWMKTDEKYGNLRSNSTGETGSYVTGLQPFVFIAADSLDVDSTVVAIEACTSSGGGAASIIGIGTNDTLQMPAGLMLKKQENNNKMGKAASLRSALMESNTKHSVEKLIKRLYAAREKTQNKSQFDKIITKIRTQYASKNELTKNADVAQKSLVKSGIAMNVEEGESCELPVAKVTIEGPKLYIYPLEGDDKIQKIEGTNPPKMPKPVIKVQLKNYEGGDVKFHWKITIKWTTGKKNWKTPRNDEKYEGDVTGSNSAIVDLGIKLDNFDMRGGDQITLTVTATADGKFYATDPTDTKNPFEIKGLNPDQNVVRTEISTVAPATVWNYVLSDIRMLYIITYQESKYNQFAPNANIVNRKDPFYPLQGLDTDDFGLMQVNKPANDDLIWNWKKNVAGGMDKFNQKKRVVARYIDDIKNATCGHYKKGKTNDGRDTLIWEVVNQPGVQADWYGDPKKPFGYNPTAMTDVQRITETFQRYNGGVYYRWKPEQPVKDPSGSGKWIEAPTKADVNEVYGGYAKDCMKWYNGTCPWE